MCTVGYCVGIYRHKEEADELEVSCYTEYIEDQEVGKVTCE